MTHQEPTASEVAEQAQAWRAALGDLATSRRDQGLLRRVEAGLTAAVATVEAFEQARA